MIVVTIPDNKRILERLRMDDTLDKYDFLYASEGYDPSHDSGTLDTKDTPKRLKMPSVVHLHAIDKNLVTDKQALIGHIRSEGMDVTKFTFVPISAVPEF